MAVFLEYGLSLESWAANHPGASHSGSPYGYAAASGTVDLTWSVDHRDGRLGGLVRRALRNHILGFDLLHAWRNRHMLATADVVWTHTEQEHLAALAVLRFLRNRRTKVVAQSVWLWDEWATLPRWRRRLSLLLLDRAAVEVTLSDANKEVAREVRRTRSVYRLPFGAAIDDVAAERVRAEPRLPDAGYVLAVGSDRHRDWSTLHAAARLLPDVRFRVATLNPSYPRADAPANVTLTAARSAEEGYRLYANAAAVVLPLTDNLHASGCTVAMEAQRMGAPLVTADVGGLGLYLGERGVGRYDEGDAESLAREIRAVLAAAEAGQDVATDHTVLQARGLTADDYAARFVLLTRWLLDGAPAPEDAERAAPVRAVLGHDPVTVPSAT